MAIGKANSEIADYLREVLPDKGQHDNQCKMRRGFERAGRWMRMSRAAGHLQDVVSSMFVSST